MYYSILLYKPLYPQSIDRYIFHNIVHIDDDEFDYQLEIVNVGSLLFSKLSI